MIDLVPLGGQFQVFQFQAKQGIIRPLPPAFIDRGAQIDVGDGCLVHRLGFRGEPGQRQHLQHVGGHPAGQVAGDLGDHEPFVGQELDEGPHLVQRDLIAPGGFDGKGEFRDDGGSDVGDFLPGFGVADCAFGEFGNKS